MTMSQSLMMSRHHELDAANRTMAQKIQLQTGGKRTKRGPDGMLRGGTEDFSWRSLLSLQYANMPVAWSVYERSRSLADQIWSSRRPSHFSSHFFTGKMSASRQATLLARRAALALSSRSAAPAASSTQAVRYFGK